MVEPITLDPANEATITIDPLQFQQDVKAVVGIVSDTGTQPAMVFSNDLNRPSFAKLGVFQNSQADRFLDLYVFSDERLYQDVLDETPVVEVTQNGTTEQVTMEVFLEPSPPNDSIIKVIYKGDYALSAGGATQIVLTGEDFAGNDILPETTGVSVKFIKADEGGEIASIDGEMHLLLSEKSLTKDTYLTVFTLESAPMSKSQRFASFGDLVLVPEQRHPIGSAYRIGPSGLRFIKPIQLSLHIENLKDLDSSQLGIYRLEGENWVYVGGTLNEESISTEIDNTGTYQVQLGPHPSLPSLPRVYSLAQNRPNPMGKETLIKYQLPGESFVSLKIYNIMGQVVRTLLHAREKAGYKAVLWKGEDQSGRNLASGVYFYTLEAGNFKKTKKLILLK